VVVWEDTVPHTREGLAALVVVQAEVAQERVHQINLLYQAQQSTETLVEALQVLMVQAVVVQAKQEIQTEQAMVEMALILPTLILTAQTLVTLNPPQMA